MASNKHIWLIAISVSMSLVVSSAKAEEFGNVFSNEERIATASREASSNALDGVIRILTAVKLREDGQGDGVEALSAAVDSFSSAYVALEQILKDPNFPDFELGEPDLAAVNRRLGGYEYFLDSGLPDARSYRSLFEIFQNQTEQMISLAKEATTVGRQQRLFGVVSRRLEWYFALADVVSELSRSSRN